jgi:hypothetical protein
MTITEEEVLVRDILRLDAQGLSTALSLSLSYKKWQIQSVEQGMPLQLE